MTNMHAIICSRVPRGAKAHRLNLNALTDELEWLARAHSAWAIWAGTHCVGLLVHHTRTGFAWVRLVDGRFRPPSFNVNFGEAVASMALDTIDKMVENEDLTIDAES